MKNFLFIAFLLTCSGVYADTIGRVHVYLRDSLIADYPEFYDGVVHIAAGTYDVTDSLYMKRYFGCGGMRKYPQYSLIIRDSSSGVIVYRDTTQRTPDFALPLAVLDSYHTMHPDAVFEGAYTPALKPADHDAVRFRIRLGT